MAQIGFEQGIRPKMGGLCNFSTGGGLSLLRSPCSPHRKSIIPPEWFELASSREFVQRWVGCATSPRGVDSRSVALPAHLTASPLSHPNGPNWLRAGNLPEDGWAVQPLHGGWTPVVTLSCSPQRKSIIPPEWPELASSREFVRRWVGCATSLRGWTFGVTLSFSPHRKSIIPHEWPELASSREFARRWVGCATSLRGVDSR